MKKINLNFPTVLLTALVSMSVISCNNDDDDTPSQISILQKAEGIIELT